MRFSVERWGNGVWSLVGLDIDASGAQQAVALAASGEGLYRANPFGTLGLNEAYLVPGWGAPSRLPEHSE